MRRSRSASPRPKSHEGTKMKKQINPSIKAHLLRSALILLSLLAMCAIPFALAQRRGVRPSPSATIEQLPASQVSQALSGFTPMNTITTPPAPRVPDVIIYDQLNSPGSQSTNSQSFEAASFNDNAADDFVVPVGQTWEIAEVDVQGVYFNCSNPCGPANSFNLSFYRDFGGLP